MVTRRHNRKTNGPLGVASSLLIVSYSKYVPHALNFSLDLSSLEDVGEPLDLVLGLFFPFLYP